MDLKVIKNLLNLISETDVNEVSIEEGDFKIKVKKKPDVINKQGSAPVYMQPDVEAHLPQQPPQQAPQQPQEPAGESADQSSNAATIKSPIVGTYYGAPSPDADPYIKIGDTVKKGDVLCIVEAMKIMNEIESEVSGKIVKKLVDDAQPVEYDQPLFLIEPA